MKRGQVFVRGRKCDGTFGTIDALDLDDASFRVFVLDMLYRADIVIGIQDAYVKSDPLPYHERHVGDADVARGTLSQNSESGSER